VSLGTGRTAKAISSAAGATCAILDNATVKCWGDNSGGSLGLGDSQARGDGPNEMGDNLPIVSLGTGRTAKAITRGAYRTCAVLDNDTVKCWGLGGNLGLGDLLSRGDGPNEMGDNLPIVPLGTGRTAKAIAAGYTHTCALLDDGSVKCWGTNGYGQLGVGDTQDRGDQPGEMGDNLPFVNLGAGRTAKAISAGLFASCAILDDDSIKCWGDDQQGQLGLGDTQSRGDAPNEMGSNLPVVSLGTGRTAKALVTGSYITCALLDNATVKCWGYGQQGWLGLGDLVSRGDGPNEMGNNLPALLLP
jgi:alpha-tubulin suppressor-like RCC1 family protein